MSDTAANSDPFAALENSTQVSMTTATPAPAPAPGAPAASTEIDATTVLQSAPPPPAAPDTIATLGPIQPLQVMPPQPAAPPANPVPATTPESAAPSAPIAPTPSAAPTPQAPADQPQPPTAATPPVRDAHVPEEIQRRYYTKHLPPETQLLVAVAAENPGLQPDEVARIVNERLGRPAAAPAAPAAQPAPQTPPAPSRLEQVNTRITEIEARLSDPEFDPIVNADELTKLTVESNRLNREFATLSYQQQQQEAQRQQQEAAVFDQQADAAFAADHAAAVAQYPDLAREDSPLAQAVNARAQALLSAQDPLAFHPNFLQIVALQTGASLGILPANAAPTPATIPQPPAPSPAASAPAGVQPHPAPAAPVAAVPASQPAPQPPGPAPLAVMPAVSGHVYTSADRVTTAPADPHAALQQQYVQAVQAGDLAAMERALDFSLTGGKAPAGPAFSISISG